MQGTDIGVVNMKKFVYKRGIFFCNKGPMCTWCGAYIHDEHIGYVACKKPISLV